MSSTIDAQKAYTAKHKKQLNECYRNLREVLPKAYTVEYPNDSSFQPDLVKDAFSNKSAGKWRILKRAKTYIEHLESVIEKVHENASNSNATPLKAISDHTAGQSKFMCKIKEGFVNNFTPDKPVREYTFDLSESSSEDEASTEEEYDTLRQNVYPDAPQRHCSSRPVQVGMSSNPLHNNFSSVLFIPINVKPAVKGTPMYVNTCGPSVTPGF